MVSTASKKRVEESLTALTTLAQSFKRSLEAENKSERTIVG